MPDDANAKTDVDDGLALAGLGDLSALLDSAGDGKFREIDLDLIGEDGENPRQDFNPETLRELADTIRLRGVITPISVRSDPENPGRFIVNHGHRRLRASRLAGRRAIPAVIDNAFQDEDRIIENIQRDNLDMFEVAGFIARKYGSGMKQKQIAELIGKSAAYVSNHMQLLELPRHTAVAVKNGRLTDLTSINELAKAERHAPERVAGFLAATEAVIAPEGDAPVPAEVTRAAVRAFRAELDASGAVAGETKKAAAGLKKTVQPEPAFHAEEPAGAGDMEKPDKPALPGPVPVRHGAQVVIADPAGRRGVLLLDRPPKAEGFGWVKWSYGNPIESEVTLSALTLRAIVAPAD